MAALTLQDLLNTNEPTLDFNPIAASLQSASAQARQRASQFYADYDSLFKPVVSDLASSARGATGVGAQEGAARSAVSDVALSHAAQRAALGRRAASMGISPSSPQYLAMLKQLSLAEAADRAGAATNARTSQVTRGQNLQTTVAGLGTQTLAAANGQTAEANATDRTLAGTALGLHQANVAGRAALAEQLGAQEASQTPVRVSSTVAPGAVGSLSNPIRFDSSYSSDPYNMLSLSGSRGTPGSYSSFNW